MNPRFKSEPLKMVKNLTKVSFMTLFLFVVIYVSKVLLNLLELWGWHDCCVIKSYIILIGFFILFNLRRKANER